MCKQYRIAKTTINDKINANEPFSYHSICDEIIANGGILRVGPAFTIGNYLLQLEEMKIIKYFPQENVFKKYEK